MQNQLTRMITKYQSSISIFLLICFFCLLFLIPFSSGEAQTSDWRPAWVDFGDSGLIHVIDLDADAAPKLESPISAEIRQNEKPISNGLSAATNKFFSSFAQITSSRETAGWETVFSDDLESTFPGEWNVFDNDGVTNGEYFWAQKDCRPYAGSYSAWVVGGGTDGSILPCGSDYPNDAKSWMIYGPFSLADATDAEFRFMYWLNSELTFDLLFAGASIDGTQFYGASTSGTYEWTERIFDLTTVDTLGDLTGEAQVWVVIAFQSDYSISVSEGAYVDDIEVRKYVGDEPTLTPTATLTATPTPPSDDSNIYLPLTLKNFPFTPESPVLNTISNADGDGNYSVSWSSSAGVNTYTLEEDSNAAFSSPTTAYTGSGTSIAISGRDVGMYYYRVRASNAHASSGWSNVETVEVTVPPPDCPQTGTWSGTTSQGRNISFVVENSPQCQIAANSLQISIRDSCYFSTTTVFGQSYTITNNHFSAGNASYGVQVIGDFTSLNTASGTFNLYMANPFPPPYNCTASGTWTGTP